MHPAPSTSTQSPNTLNTSPSFSAGSPPPLSSGSSTPPTAKSLPLTATVRQLTANQRQLKATHCKLIASRSQIDELTKQLKLNNFIVGALVKDLRRLKNPTSANQIINDPSILNYINGVPNETKLAIGPHKLPLGHSYILMLDGVVFKRLRWKVGLKLDHQVDENEW
ncbi:hypothetical protein RHSIM_Rhsim11G0116600 [Rhododendron simsii]|uniref:Uncharacterized protein n=1 Tax=Rhododendron simsii TaxID=118357 RepID=A0A834G4F2_RHOSS|nr:hypothetical protein RHSIM_Rhsim11G0116600 [Rhododendron simsii]